MKQNKLYIFVIIVFLIIIIRLCYLTLIKHDYYKSIVLKNNNKIIEGYSAPRGRIIDTNGNIIVDNKGVKTIIYNKLNGVSNSEELSISDKLALIIDIETGNDYEQKNYFYLKNKEIIDKRIDKKIIKKYNERKIDSTELLKNKMNLITLEDLNSLSEVEKKSSKIYNIMNNGYSYQDKIIKSNCSDEEYNKVIEANIGGVRSELTFERINNYEGILSEVIGTVGKIRSEDKEYYLSQGYSLNDIVGTTYLEKYYEKYLRGVKAKYKVNSDNTITKISNYIAGNDLVLNIDIVKQKKIEKLLEEQIILAKKNVSSKYYNGSYIIVSDPNTGGIISFVGKSYDNGIFYNNELGNITKSYTIGSAVKAATISVGYKYNVIDIGDKVTDSCVKLKSQTEKCSWKKLGRIDDIQALAYSSNYYQFMIAIGLTGETYKYNMKLNNVNDAFTKYREMLKSYGLGNITGIDLENETTGIIGNTKTADLLLNLSIGQYDTYTPIEISQYINTVANSGSRIKPSLMKKIISSTGEIVLENKNEVLNKVELEEKYKERIKEGLKSVSLYGTGASYINKKYKASGKTGTSESFYDSDLDGIADTETTTKTFIAYMPNDTPLYSIVIISPNIDYKNSPSKSVYPINSYLARNISNILFDN